MRGRVLASRRWWLAAASFAGVVLTHALSYRLVSPDHDARSELLHHTGHAVWPPLAAAAVLAALVAAVAGALTRPATAGASSVASTATRLAWLQGVGWVAVESTERLVSGAPLSGSTVLPMFVGVVVQVAVAVAAAAALALVAAAAVAIRARRDRVPVARRGRWPLPTPATARTRVVLSAWSSRAPPSL